jgi:hypothetical protein
MVVAPFKPICFLNGPELEDLSGLNIGQVEDVHRSISLMVPAAVDPDNS